LTLAADSVKMHKNNSFIFHTLEFMAALHKSKFLLRSTPLPSIVKGEIMTKQSEHLRRLVLRHAPRALAVLLAVGGLGVTSVALLHTVNTVRVTDTAGATHVLLTAVRDPNTLAELAGLTLDVNDSAFYTANSQGEGTGTLEVIRAFPTSMWPR
jgi:hypothetical protein